MLIKINCRLLMRVKNRNHVVLLKSYRSLKEGIMKTQLLYTFPAAAQLACLRNKSLSVVAMLCLEEGEKLLYYGRHDITIFTHLFKHKVNMCTGHISRVSIVSPRHKLHPYRSGTCKYRRACLYLTCVNIHHLRASWQKGGIHPGWRAAHEELPEERLAGGRV